MMEIADTNAKINGSSPRAWGLFAQDAQKTMYGAVHPHVRGVYACSSSKITQDGGSSPRAWGLCGRGRERDILPRFIPTCVGFISGTWIRACQLAVHPHVRGVYVCSRLLPPFVTRFIPTCVGFIYAAHRTQPLRPVHPHVRGVYGVTPKKGQILNGSSPRAWGLWV